MWWKVTHSLPYHGEDIVETRYVQAESIEEVIDVLKTHIHPDRVMFDLYSITFEVVEESQIEEQLIWNYVYDKGQMLRSKLVAVSLNWQKTFGIAPAVTTAISEFDAAILTEKAARSRKFLKLGTTSGISSYGSCIMNNIQ